MENQSGASNEVRKVVTVTPISIDKVYIGDFQKEGTKSAQLRQVITTKSYYPSKQVSSDLKDNPFSMVDFGFEEQEFETQENRVAWVDVPTDATSDDVLAKLPVDGKLYRIMSNRPILSNHQAYSIEVGLKTMEEYADSQVVRFGEAHAEGGQLIKDTNGKPQYRAIFYSNTPKGDVEMRTERADDFYASASIKAELLGAHTAVGQTL
jgi:hypothetical protein